MPSSRRAVWAVLLWNWWCMGCARSALAAVPDQEVGVPTSPCPGVFRFDRRGAAWQAVITVPAPPTGMPLALRVDIAIAAALTKKYAGTLQLQEGRRNLLARLAAGDQRPVRYVLRFPHDTPLPSVTRVFAMGRVLCRGRGDGAVRSPGVLTTISLEHSVRPERVRHRPDAPAPAAATPLVQLFQQQSEAAEQVAEDVVEENHVCGQPVHHRLLVAGGDAPRPGDWPWLAAVFAITSLGVEFHCAGSLVSPAHVLTAAHCVHRHKPEALIVYLGRHNVRKWTEPQEQAREVAEIRVHPEHQAGNYTADLAVLTLSERVAVDWFVRPVCVDWAGPDSLAAVVGRVGTVVGWGTNVPGHALSDEPRAARLPIVSQETCLRSRSEFLHVTSEKTFCAGYRDGTGPCNGDSGSGLVLPSTSAPDAEPTGPWYLRGVVSLSLTGRDRRTCDLDNFVVFTDVAKFRGWLASLIQPQLQPQPQLIPQTRRPARPATKHVETQTDLVDEPIWDSDVDQS